MKVLFFLAFLITQIAATTANVLVTRVIDGDTLYVKNGSVKQKIRLWGIDAPELSQKDGAKSGRFLATRISGEWCTIKIIDTDRYGRLVAKIYDSNETYVNEEMVRLGLAWVYTRYVNETQPDWVRYQQQARDKKIGLWRRRNPTEPWLYRQSRRKNNR